jgi:DNA-binding NarL/FixJ family response regulator
MIRVGVSKVLADCEIRVVAEVADAPSAVAAVRAHEPELLIAGRHDGSQGDLVARALGLAAGLRCIALLGTPGDLRPVMTAGAHGAVSRGVDPVELADVVRRVMAGDRVVSPGLLPRLFDDNGGNMTASPAALAQSGTVDQPDDATAPVAALTGREREILRLLGAGRTNAEIASALFVSGATVKTHLAHIYGKLGARGRYEALGRAVALGLLD